ncbi:MAG: RidA family protein [Blastocatellia bacterium]
MPGIRKQYHRHHQLLNKRMSGLSPRLLPALFLLLTVVPAATAPRVPERKVIVPENAAKPVGPYSPGVLTSEYLYVSGQGVRDAANTMPATVAAQAKQCLENVRAIVNAAGLTMDHVVHMQLYLERLSDLAEVDRVYTGYFPHHPPARVVIGVSKMPTDTPIEMTAVAVRDINQKKIMTINALPPLGHASSAVRAGGRVYLSGVYGKTPAAAEARLKKVLAEIRMKPSHIVWRNDYARAATATVPANELPLQSEAAISSIAARDATGGKTPAAICRADGKTVFCTAQTGVDDNAATVQEQVKAVMEKLYAGLQQHGATLPDVTASNVYLDDIREFRQMNETYASFFSASPPTRTTVQPFPVVNRAEGKPALVRISVIAVKE